MPRSRCTPAGAVLLATALALAPSPAAAQYLGGGARTGPDVQLADLEQLRDKFLALAEAFPEETYEWRPMEGVRSVRQVFALIAGEGVLFPTMWGFEAPDWAEGDFNRENARLAALSREELIAELERSFEHLVALVRGLSDEDRVRQVRFFGLTVDLSTALTLMATDMHEHLGQAIAYARVNRIVPPWSRPGS